MRTHLVCLLAVLAGLTVSSSGCLLVAAGAGAAGTVAYMRGDLEVGLPYHIEFVYDATRQAMTQLQLPVVEGRTMKDALSATIVARDAEDKRVTIKLRSESELSTRISIRIGTFGDQTKSQMIYDRIRDNLRVSDGSAPVADPAPRVINPVLLPSSAPSTPACATRFAHCPGGQSARVIAGRCFRRDSLEPHTYGVAGLGGIEDQPRIGVWSSGDARGSVRPQRGQSTAWALKSGGTLIFRPHAQVRN